MSILLIVFMSTIFATIIGGTGLHLEYGWPVLMYIAIAFALVVGIGCVLLVTNRTVSISPPDWIFIVGAPFFWFLLLVFMNEAQTQLRQPWERDATTDMLFQPQWQDYTFFHITDLFANTSVRLATDTLANIIVYPTSSNHTSICVLMDQNGTLAHNQWFHRVTVTTLPEIANQCRVFVDYTDRGFSDTLSVWNTFSNAIALVIICFAIIWYAAGNIWRSYTQIAA